MNIAERTNIALPQALPKLNSQPRRRKVSWFAIFCAFTDRGMPLVSPSAVSVWLVLFRYSRHYEVKMGIEQIAKMTGLGDRCVRTKLRELMDAKLLRRVSRGRKNCGTTRWRLAVPPAREQESGT